MDAVARKIREVDLNSVPVLAGYYDDDTLIIVSNDFILLYDFNDPTHEWIEIQFNYEPKIQYEASYYDNEILVIMSNHERKNYLLIINTKTGDQQLLDLDQLFGNNSQKLLLGFRYGSVFIGCYDDVYHVVIKEMSISDFNIFDLGTLEINENTLISKVLISFNTERLLFSKSENIYTIISLSSPQEPLFYSELTLRGVNPDVNSQLFPGDVGNLRNKPHMWTNPHVLDSPIALDECFIVNRPGKDIILFHGFNHYIKSQTYYTFLREDGIFRLKIEDENEDNNERRLLSTSVVNNVLYLVYHNPENFSGKFKIQVFTQDVSTITYNPTKGAHNR